MAVQLDLFLDSQAVRLANEVVDALAARDADRARVITAQLRSEAPDYPSAAALETLTAALAAWRPARADGAAIACAVDRVDHGIAPVARQALGEGAVAFIAGFFRDLAEAARGLDYDPVRPRAHRAWLCLRCGEWEEAEAAADSIPHPAANPDAIHWRCVARYRRHGLDAARAGLFALAWLAPQRLPSVLAELRDELLDRDWQRFEHASEWESVREAEVPGWFPAWYLLAHPAVGAALRGVEFPDIPAAEAARLVLELLDLERQGNPQRLVGRRGRLRQLNPDFFSLYMASRAVRHL